VCAQGLIIEKNPQRWLMRALTAFPFLLAGLVSATLQAQTDTRADVLMGRVTDVTGRPVAGAEVGATSSGTGRMRSITTDEDGRYRIYFPETSSQYTVLVKRMGFAPVQRTITRHTAGAEQMTIDLQLGGAPLALSMVEVNGEAGIETPTSRDSRAEPDATVPNPVAEILALKDTLHLSAVQVVGLTDVADSLQAKNTRIYRNIKTLLAKSQEAGDITQMAGSVAMMLEEASGNTARAVTAAAKLLRPEQQRALPQAIRDQFSGRNEETAKR
jgi:hypothetical protein